jgi:surface antigen
LSEQNNPAPPAAAATIAPVQVVTSLDDIPDPSRTAARNAFIQSLDKKQKRSWRSADGLFGYIEVKPGSTPDCQAWTHKIYIAGRGQLLQGNACRQGDGQWAPG